MTKYETVSERTLLARQSIHPIESQTVSLLMTRQSPRPTESQTVSLLMTRQSPQPTESQTVSLLMTRQSTHPNESLTVSLLMTREFAVNILDTIRARRTVPVLICQSIGGFRFITHDLHQPGRHLVDVGRTYASS